MIILATYDFLSNKPHEHCEIFCFNISGKLSFLAKFEGQMEPFSCYINSKKWEGVAKK